MALGPVRVDTGLMTDTAPDTSPDTSPDTAPLRRLVVALTIGSFSIAALMGVIALLGRGNFGEREGQVLLTTLIVGATSVAMLCYLATSGTRFQAFGVVGGTVVLVPFVTSLLTVWGDDRNAELAQTFGVGLVLAATLAQLSLLLALAGARARVRIVLWSTVVLATAVAVMVSGLIITEGGSDGLLRLIGVLAILDVLGTVVTLALALFGKPSADDPEAPVRLPSRLGQLVTVSAAERGVSREQVVVDALDRYFAERSAP